MPAAVQLNAIAAFRYRFTLRQTRRTVPIMFSIELVQASERLSFSGKPRRLTAGSRGARQDMGLARRCGRSRHLNLSNEKMWDFGGERDGKHETCDEGSANPSGHR